MSEKQASSSYRELLAIHRTFTLYKDYFESMRNKLLIWLIDNQAVPFILNHGSRVSSLQTLVIDIKEIAYFYDIVVIPIWTPRLDPIIVMADLGSKLSTSSEEYGLNHFVLLHIQEQFELKIDIDCFSSYKNYRCSIFWSSFPQPGVSAIDFFYQTLPPFTVLYIHPPVKMILKALKKFLKSPNLVAIFVLPYWPSCAFWPAFTEGKFFPKFVGDFLLFHPHYVPFSTKTMFHGFMKFPTLILKCYSSGNFKIPFPIV